MFYQIIKDENLLEDFIEWLPELEKDEKYYVSLFSRKKYCNNPDDLKADKCQLKRFVTDKKRLFNKLRQLELKIGSYEQDDKPVPIESLAVYISINPRSTVKASKKTLIDLAHKVTEYYSGYNPSSLALNNYQKSCGTKHFIDIDFDDVKYYDLKDKIDQSINSDCYTVLETRGGFHLIIEVKKIDSRYTKSWYKNLTSIGGSDISGDNLIPIPGCTQGNFIPHLIKDYKGFSNGKKYLY